MAAVEKTMDLCEAYSVTAILTQHLQDIAPSLSSLLLPVSLATCVISPALYSEIKL